MKRIGVVIVLWTAGLQANNFTGHTFFSVRPQFQSGSPEKESLFRSTIRARKDGWQGALQVVPFGGQSTDADCHRLAQYFMPFGKTAIIAGEYGSQAALSNNADIIANYFGVLTANPLVTPGSYNIFPLTFQSTISIKPSQSVVACGFHYAQMLSCQSDGTGGWFDIALPVEQVKNKINYKEVVTNAGGGAVQPGYVATVGDALRGEVVFGDQKFKYGKITANNCALKKTGVADIQARLGYTVLQKDHGYVDGYIGLVIPTGNRPKAEYIFESIVGNNHHWGVQFGTLDGAELWSNDCRSIWFEGVINGQFLFHNTQRRSLDLVDKQWSRYIALYPSAEATPISGMVPGINILTRDLRVAPRFSLTMNLSLRWQELMNGFEFEAGYNFYGRQAEQVCLKCPWVPGPGIIGINPDDSTALETKNNANMSRALPIIGTIDVDRNVDTGVSTFITIKASDLNLASAAHPTVILNMVYGTAGYRFDVCDFPFLAALGGSYEFSSNNAGLNRWNVWGKVALSI